MFATPTKSCPHCKTSVYSLDLELRDSIACRGFVLCLSCGLEGPTSGPKSNKQEAWLEAENMWNNHPTYNLLRTLHRFLKFEIWED